MKNLTKRGTAAAWGSSNPVLDAGEFGYDRTNKKVKMGDGVTAWNSLPFYTTAAEIIPIPSGQTASSVIPNIKSDITALQTQKAATIHSHPQNQVTGLVAALSTINTNIGTNTTAISTVSGNLALTNTTLSNHIAVALTSPLAIDVDGNAKIVSNIVLTSSTADNLKLNAYSEKHLALGNVVTTATIDLVSTSVFSMTLTGPTAISFINPGTAGFARSFTVVVTNAAAGISFTNTIKYADGIAPDYSNAVDVLSFFTIDGGASYFCIPSVISASVGI